MGPPSAALPAAQLLCPLSYSTTLDERKPASVISGPPKFSKAIQTSDSAFYRVALPRIKRFRECDLFNGPVLG